MLFRHQCPRVWCTPTLHKHVWWKSLLYSYVLWSAHQKKCVISSEIRLHQCFESLEARQHATWQVVLWFSGFVACVRSGSNQPLIALVLEALGLRFLSSFWKKFLAPVIMLDCKLSSPSVTWLPTVSRPWNCWVFLKWNQLLFKFHNKEIAQCVILHTSSSASGSCSIRMMRSWSLSSGLSASCCR